MAQEVKHSRAPWGSDSEYGTLITAADGTNVAVTLNPFNATKKQNPVPQDLEEVKANACLIVAAPEMYVELRGCRCPRPFNSRPDEFTVGECVDTGECGCSCGAAITKAEGRP